MDVDYTDGSGGASGAGCGGGGSCCTRAWLGTSFAGGSGTAAMTGCICCLTGNIGCRLARSEVALGHDGPRNRSKAEHRENLDHAALFESFELRPAAQLAAVEKMKS